MEGFYALLGALVGGIAAGVGSIIANRREHTRQYRARLMIELLPRLHRLTFGEDAEPSLRRAAFNAGEIIPLADEIVQVAKVAGPRDAEVARPLTATAEALFARTQSTAIEDAHGNPRVLPEEVKREVEAFGEAVKNLEEWLERKVL